MITYELYNVEGEPPQLQKVISVGGETFKTNLTYNNKEELDVIPEETVRQHMNNVVAYVSYLASGVEILPEGQAEMEQWPIKNVGEIVEYIETGSRWWQYLYYRSEEYNDVVINTLTLSAEEHDALHSEDYIPHTHDPETGDVVLTEDGQVATPTIEEVHTHNV